jgi:(p)ppGpp synthase/HD superfamily hydrolase
MILTARLEKALAITLRIHQHQKRKGDNATPYAVHPVSVAMLLAQYTDDEDIIIAGLLHDALEDTKYGPKEIERDFGSRVLGIVQEVTEKNPRASWETRKFDYLVEIKNRSKEACLVALADKIHNIKSLQYAYATLGENLWKRFNASKEKKLWFYDEIYKSIKKKFRHGLVRELHHVLKEIKGEKQTPEQKAQKFIGPFEVVQWVHFSLNSDKGEYFRVRTYPSLKQASHEADRLTRIARQETLKGVDEIDPMKLRDYWDMSSSFGVVDDTNNIAFWADWFKV